MLSESLMTSHTHTDQSSQCVCAVLKQLWCRVPGKVDAPSRTGREGERVDGAVQGNFRNLSVAVPAEERRLQRRRRVLCGKLRRSKRSHVGAHVCAHRPLVDEARMGQGEGRSVSGGPGAVCAGSRGARGPQERPVVSGRDGRNGVRHVTFSVFIHAAAR